jgi:uncharacterized beta-barrel protein YwiB (DUF1934 family)
MLQINPNQKTDITLTIKTTVIDPEKDFTDGEDILAMIKRITDGDNTSKTEILELLGEEAVSDIELCTEAELAVNDKGCVEISYIENEDDEQIKTLSKIIFHPRSPGLVVMTKEGAMKAILSFEEGRTHICTYDTPFMPIKVYVDANRVDNRLLSSGTLRLNYVLHLNDTPPQHFIVEVKIKESPEDTLKNILS